MAKELDISTLGVRAGTARSRVRRAFRGAVPHLELRLRERRAGRGALHRRRRQAAIVYSRFTNPTVAMFQDRLAALEGAESCVATASGMAAILATAMALLKAGDHVVCSNAVFGATVQLFDTILSDASASRPPSSRRRGSRSGSALPAEHEAVLPRDAVQSADRDLRHPGARGGREEGRRCCSSSTTCSARRRCSGRSSWAPTW